MGRLVVGSLDARLGLIVCLFMGLFQVLFLVWVVDLNR